MIDKPERRFCLVKFGTGSNNELTQKYVRVKVQMTYVRPHIYVNKNPQFSI